MNCSCIVDSISNAVEAVDGTCSGPDCTLMPLFLVLFFVAMFAMFAADTMVFPAMFRYQSF